MSEKPLLVVVNCHIQNEDKFESTFTMINLAAYLAAIDSNEAIFLL